LGEGTIIVSPVTKQNIGASVPAGILVQCSNLILKMRNKNYEKPAKLEMISTDAILIGPWINESVASGQIFFHLYAKALQSNGWIDQFRRQFRSIF
jgi:hypothetical protein